MAIGAVAPKRMAAADATDATVLMLSAPDGSDVWFDPIGLWVAPGASVTWINGTDQANTHTTTAYHPANNHRPLRIPDGAEPWDSGYVLPGEQFTVTLKAEGVYDYFCQPHELAGMVGRIVVGRPAPGDPEGLPVAPEAQRAFPSVEDILLRKVVHR